MRDRAVVKWIWAIEPADDCLKVLLKLAHLSAKMFLYFRGCFEHRIKIIAIGMLMEMSFVG